MSKAIRIYAARKILMMSTRASGHDAAHILPDNARRFPRHYFRAPCAAAGGG